MLIQSQTTFEAQLFGSYNRQTVNMSCSKADISSTVSHSRTVWWCLLVAAPPRLLHTGCWFFFFLFSLSAWAGGWWQVRKPHQPHPVLLISELQRGWEEALSRLQAFHKNDASCVLLCSPFTFKALINKTYNLHKITKESSFILFSLFILLHVLLLLSFILFVLFMSFCWQRSLALFLCHITLDITQRRNSFSSQRGGFFGVSASVPANDEDYFGDLLLPLWWIMQRHAVMSPQKKWKNGTSACLDNLKKFIFNLAEWLHPKLQWLRSITP